MDAAADSTNRNVLCSHRSLLLLEAALFGVNLIQMHCLTAANISRVKIEAIHYNQGYRLSEKQYFHLLVRLPHTSNLKVPCLLSYKCVFVIKGKLLFFIKMYANTHNYQTEMTRWLVK